VAVAPPPPPAPPSASPAGAAARHALDEAVAHLPPGSLADVHIRMDDAVAYLDGTVNSSEAQQQLATAVGSAPGVKAVDARALRVEGRRHVVTLGENLYDLAQRYYGRGDLWTDILKANPGVKPNQMEVGRVLIIPPASHEKRD
jgi:5'-nucleotidase